MRVVLMAGLAGAFLIGCGDSGPSPEELAAKKMDKECSKLYGALSKAVTEQLNKGGVGGVVLGEKDGFIKLCAEQHFTEPQLKCMDPNLGGTEECKKELEEVKDKTKKLQEYLLAPMKEKQKGEKAKAE